MTKRSETHGAREEFVGGVAGLSPIIAADWTPNPQPETSGSYTVDPDTAIGRYQRIGNFMFATFQCFITGVVAPVGNLAIHGLPAGLGASASVAAGSVWVNNLSVAAGNGQLVLRISFGESTPTPRIFQLVAGVIQPAAALVLNGSALQGSVCWMLA